MSINFNEMKNVASQYLDALLKEPLNMENSLETFERILSTNFTFFTILTCNSNNDVINNQEGKAEFIHKIKKMHFENVTAIISREPEEYFQSNELNQIICKVKSVQSRLGNGINEANGAGNYKLTSTTVISFVTEDGQVKISKIFQPNYNKEFIPSRPQSSTYNYFMGIEGPIAR